MNNTNFNKNQFIDKCLGLLDGYSADEITIQDMAYQIVQNGISNNLIEDFELEEIIELSGNLELPIHQQSGNHIDNRKRLIKLVKNLKNRK